MRDLMRLAAWAAIGPCSLWVATPAMAAGSGSDPVSTIVGADGRCLGVNGSTTASGAALQGQTCNGTAFQNWRFVKDASGDYQLINAGSGLCLDIPGASTASGTALQQWGCSSGAAWQKWHFNADGHGRYYITSKASGLAIDADIYSRTGAIIQWAYGGTSNQLWTSPSVNLAATGPANNSVITLKSVRDGSCLGVKGSSVESGAKVKVQACSRSGSVFQQWKTVKDGTGDYQLVNVGSGLCLDMPGASTVPGTSVQQWGCGGAAWQKWQFNADGRGNYYITSKVSGLALDEDINSTAGNVIQWKYSGTANQQWIATSSSSPGAPGAGATGGTGSTAGNGTASGAASSGGAAGTGAGGTGDAADKGSTQSTASLASPVGFGAGTTGGAGGSVVTVTKPDQLASALCATTSNDGYCTDTTPKVIRISGLLDFRGKSGTTTASACIYSDRSCSANGKSERILNYTEYCKGRQTAPITFDTAGGYAHALVVGSNKTVIGVGAGSGIVGKGLAIKGGVSNIIVRNLSFTDINDGIVWAGDAITIDNASKIWIDHNYFARIARQMLVTGWGTARNVTISGNHFDGTTEYGHFCNGRSYWVMLLNGEEQTITIVGNRIHNTSGRSPELGKPDGKQGGVIHLVNNYYDNNYWQGGLTGTNSVAALVEGNYYAKGDSLFPIFDNTPNKTDTNSNWNFAPIAGTLARANGSCLSILGRNCVANVDYNLTDNKDAWGNPVFLLNPAAMSRIQGFSGAANGIKSVTPADASAVPNWTFGPQANIVQ